MKDARLAHAEALVARFSVNGVLPSDFFDVVRSIEGYWLNIVRLPRHEARVAGWGAAA